MDVSEVDRVSRWRALFRWATRPTKPDQEPWRRLALRLRYDMSAPEGPRSVMLATPVDDGLEAHCALELAESLAEELGKPVLVVDAAPRERRLSRLLKCSELRGLTDVLVDPRTPLADIVLPTTHPNVAVVPAGIVADPVGHVAAEELGNLLKVFQRDHEVVLFCGGSVPSNGLALALAPVVGRVLLLATENVTTSRELDAAQDCLHVRNARDVGLVLATRTPDIG
jgi:Mrp family chromosome partitioning ATPase